jgi:hypothetical protein
MILREISDRIFRRLVFAFFPDICSILLFFRFHQRQRKSAQFIGSPQTAGNRFAGHINLFHFQLTTGGGSMTVPQLSQVRFSMSP